METERPQCQQGTLIPGTTAAGAPAYRYCSDHLCDYDVTGETPHEALMREVREHPIPDEIRDRLDAERF